MKHLIYDRFDIHDICTRYRAQYSDCVTWFSLGRSPCTTDVSFVNWSN